MDVEIGLRVVRGPHWRWGEQDGGDGHVGTVVSVHHLQQPQGEDPASPPPCAVTVQWDCGNRCRYRCGIGDKYDLRVLDSAPAGMVHNRIVCNNCDQSLSGIRWKCVRCCDFDLCTLCYMSGQHNLEHEFDRLDTPNITTRLPTRVSSKKKDARGIFPRSLVEPGRDWVQPKNQGPTSVFVQGEVSDVVGKDGDNSRSHVEVVWTDSQVKTVHCVGHQGKVELKCVDPSSIGYYYPDHLPDLGAPIEENEEEEAAVTEGVSPGDFVRAELDPEVFKAMHEESVGWSDQMMEMLGVIGQVQTVLPSGNVRVLFNNLTIWTLCAGAVVKVDMPHFKVGDLVKIERDFIKVTKLQKGHGECGHCTSSLLGEVCRVFRILPRGDIYIIGKGSAWIFNPQLVSRHDELASLPWPNPLIPSSQKGGAPEGNLDRIRGYLEINAAQVNKRRVGRTALHCAAALGDTAMIKLLLQFGATVDIADEKGYKPLHYCAMRGYKEAGQVLVDGGADVNVTGPDGTTPVILAAAGGHVALLRMLVAQPKININTQDSDGNTALHIAVLTQKRQSIAVLLEAGADASMINFSLYNPVVVAAFLGFGQIVDQILAKHPDLINCATSEYGSTPLHMAATSNHIDVVRRLLSKRGIVVDCRNDIEQTPLHVAIIRGNTTIIEMLISHGADVNTGDIDGMVPLHMILYCRDSMHVPSDLCPEILKVQTVLMGQLLDNHSCVYGPIIVSAYLLRKGADIHQKNRKGQSPLEFCPYLATLMTVLAENEDLFEGATINTSQIPHGLLNLYGGRPTLHRRIYQEGQEPGDGDHYHKNQQSFAGVVGRSDVQRDNASHGQSQQNPYGSFYASRDGGDVSSYYNGGGGQAYGNTRAADSSYASGGVMSHGHGAGGVGASSGYYTTGSEYGGYQNGVHSPQGYSRSTPVKQPTASMHVQRGQSDVSSDLCFLCDGRADVRFEPCGHSSMCSHCAARAKRCPVCRNSISSYSRL